MELVERFPIRWSIRWETCGLSLHLKQRFSIS